MIVAQVETTRAPMPSVAQSKKQMDSSEDESEEDDDEESEQLMSWDEFQGGARLLSRSA